MWGAHTSLNRSLSALLFIQLIDKETQPNNLANNAEDEDDGDDDDIDDYIEKSEIVLIR